MNAWSSWSTAWAKPRVQPYIRAPTVPAEKPPRDARRIDSIGILYSLVTLHLGFDFNSDEYKIMGLAPYGDPSALPGVLLGKRFKRPPDGTTADSHCCV